MKDGNTPLTDAHTFVICAYKESPYLEDCIKSVINQTCPGIVKIATSTPSGFIDSLAARYDLQVLVNEGECGLAGDWNFALSCADTRYVTIAHQDDIYKPDYRECMLKALDSSANPIIAFSDYAELRDGEEVFSNRLLRIKRFLLFPLRTKINSKSRFWRRRSLSLGNAICCPSVTINTGAVDLPLFENNMKSNIDWQAWEVLSRKIGSFVYVNNILMDHRIHTGSTTSQLINADLRRGEDIFMFRKFWPEPIAVFIEHFYCRSEKSNKL